MFKDSVSTTTPEQRQQRLTRPNRSSFVANDDTGAQTENPVVEISRDIFRLEADIRKLTIRVDKRLLTRNIQESLRQFRKNFDLYFESFKKPVSPDAIIPAGANVATYGESVGHVLNRFSSLGFENRRLAQQIIQRARSINNAFATKRDAYLAGLNSYDEADLPQVERISDTPVTSASVSEKPFSAYADSLSRSRASAVPAQPAPASSPKSTHSEQVSTQSASQVTEQVKDTASDEQSKKIEAQLEKNRRHMQYFVANAKKAEAAYNTRYNKIKQLHREAVEEISESRREIDDLKSRVAKNTVAKNFEQCAEEERQNANFYRYSAFAYMGVFFTLMGFLFMETGSAGFDWVRTALRSLIAFTVLIPCAYVAKESRIHRQRQHDYSRTALELGVLAPFKANLPESSLEPLREEIVQNGLKAKNLNRSYTDYYLMKNFDLLSELNQKLNTEAAKKTAEENASSDPEETLS